MEWEDAGEGAAPADRTVRKTIAEAGIMTAVNADRMSVPSPDWSQGRSLPIRDPPADARLRKITAAINPQSSS